MLFFPPVQNNTGVSLQPLENATNDVQILVPCTFRPFGQVCGLFIDGPGLPGLGEQVGVVNKMFPDLGIGFFVMSPNRVQISRGHGQFDQSAGQPDSVVLVGARQGRQDPASRPCGNMAFAQSVQDFFRQIVHQGQPSTDPTGITSQLPGNLGHAPVETSTQVPDQKALFHGLPLALLALAQDHGQHVGFAFVPDVGVQDVHLQKSDGLQAQIAVNEHETVLFPGHQHGSYLPIATHGGDQRVQFPGPLHARVCVSGDDLEVFDLGRHARGHSSTNVSMPITSILCNHPQIIRNPLKFFEF